jgi:hypothetical protein
MGLKGSGPFFQRSMSYTVLVHQICELYICTDSLVSFLHNLREVFERLREFNVAVNQAKTKLGQAEVERILRHNLWDETVRGPTG